MTVDGFAGLPRRARIVAWAAPLLGAGLVVGAAAAAPPPAAEPLPALVLPAQARPGRLPSAPPRTRDSVGPHDLDPTEARSGTLLEAPAPS